MDNHGFTLASGLWEINISLEDKPRPTYVNAKSNHEYKPELKDLLEEI